MVAISYVNNLLGWGFPRLTDGLAGRVRDNRPLFLFFFKRGHFCKEGGFDLLYTDNSAFPNRPLTMTEQAGTSTNEHLLSFGTPVSIIFVPIIHNDHRNSRALRRDCHETSVTQRKQNRSRTHARDGDALHKE